MTTNCPDDISLVESGQYIRFRSVFKDPDGAEVPVTSGAFRIYYEPSGISGTLVASGSIALVSGASGKYDGFWQSSGSLGLYRYDVSGALNPSGYAFDATWFMLKKVVV